jgi:MFS family permease
MRVVQGIASAPLETLVTSTVSDMYFVHQRGTRIAVWGCMLASGVLLGYVAFHFERYIDVLTLPQPDDRWCNHSEHLL